MVNEVVRVWKRALSPLRQKRIWRWSTAGLPSVPRRRVPLAGHPRQRKYLDMAQQYQHLGPLYEVPEVYVIKRVITNSTIPRLSQPVGWRPENGLRSHNGTGCHCRSIRTPMGRSKGGAFRNVRAEISPLI